MGHPPNMATILSACPRKNQAFSQWTSNTRDPPQLRPAFHSRPAMVLAGDASLASGTSAAIFPGTKPCGAEVEAQRWDLQI